MKRSPLRRKTGLKRSRSLAKTSKKRAGLSREQHQILYELHRSVVMARARAFRFEEDGRRKYYGACERCGRMVWLSVCHIFPQGKFPNSKYDADNAWAGCWLCHLGPGGWHKDPDAAVAWITDHMGKERYARLKLRVHQKPTLDFHLERMFLERALDQIRRAIGPALGKHALTRVQPNDPAVKPHPRRQ